MTNADRVTDAHLQRAQEDLARLNFKLGNATTAHIRSQAQHESDAQTKDAIARQVLDAQDNLADLTKAYHTQRRTLQLAATGGDAPFAGVLLVGEKASEQVIPPGGRTLTDAEKAEAERQQRESGFDDAGGAAEKPAPKEGDTERVSIEDKAVDKPAEPRPRVTFSNQADCAHAIVGDYFQVPGSTDVYRLVQPTTGVLPHWELDPPGARVGDLPPAWIAPSAEKATATAKRPDDGTPEVDFGELTREERDNAVRLPDAQADGWGNERWRLTDGRLAGDELPF